MAVLLFVLALVLLVVGAEALVRGASRLATAVGLSPLVIGLTVVAFGTSAPEMAVSIKAALTGQADIAVGNVVGSNIFNVLFILGLSALIVPLTVARQLIRFDVPLMIVASGALLVMGLDGRLGLVEGLVLVAGLTGYLVVLLRMGRREAAEVQAEYAQEFGVTPRAARQTALNVGMVVVGLVMLVVGSRWLVSSAVAFAEGLGVSELVIGLTIVAAGTSLPEVVTSIVAAVRGERDIAVGNVVGSNVFNLLGVLGVSTIVSPEGVGVAPSALAFDIPVMIAVAFACMPVFFTRGEISRWEGALLLAFYAAYTVYLVLAASAHDALTTFGTAMGYFAVPLALLTLVVIALHEWRRRRNAPHADAGEDA